MDLAFLLGLLGLSSVLVTAHSKTLGGPIMIQADEAAAEPKKADEAIVQADAPMTSSTFFIMDETLYSWKAAQEACQSKGAELATVQSRLEQELLYKYINIQRDLGRMNLWNNHWYWLGPKCGEISSWGFRKSYNWCNTNNGGFAACVIKDGLKWVSG